MYLTNEEEKILKGEEGPGMALAMELLVKIGDVFDADRLIPVKLAHWGLSGQEGDLAFAEELASGGAKVKVPTTTNPAWDYELINEFNAELNEYEINLLKRTYEVCDKLKVTKSFSCIPMFGIEDKVKIGDHLAFSESSTPPYLNSILGARTNRESSASALAAGIIGKTPNYGLHLDENRLPNLEVEIDFEPDDFEFGLLGVHLGNLLSPKDVPLIKGIKTMPSPEALRDFGAMLNVTGTTAMYHLYRLTPEIIKLENQNMIPKNLEKIHVEKKEIEDLKSRLKQKTGPINSVFMGCPHSTYSEIIKVNQMLGNRKVSKNVSFIICTSAVILEKLKQDGTYSQLVMKGVKIVKDTCVDEPIFKQLEGALGATNSYKAYYYRQRRNHELAVLPLKDLVEAAVKGKND